ncbi:MAG: phage terminase large subunit, partial [Lactococcus chungangensis]|nr:phage terminase large subunit [Lactococcus chungangensis]
MSPAFYDVHKKIRSGEIHEDLEKGGRGGAKSSFISLEIPMLLIKHPNVHAAVFRKVGNTLRNSVYA